MSNAEGGIASQQARNAQADGIQKHHKATIGYLNDRVLTFIFMLLFIGLVIVWMTSSSPLITYGSIVAVVFVIILGGAFSIKRIHKKKAQRQQQAQEWKSES